MTVGNERASKEIFTRVGKNLKTDILKALGNARVQVAFMGKHLIGLKKSFIPRVQQTFKTHNLFLRSDLEIENSFTNFFSLFQTPESCRSPFLSSNSGGSSRATNGGGRSRRGGSGSSGNTTANFPPELPPTSTRPPRPMAMSEQQRGWDNGVGGYQTNTMLETRLGGGGTGLGGEDKNGAPAHVCNNNVACYKSIHHLLSSLSAEKKVAK